MCKLRKSLISLTILMFVEFRKWIGWVPSTQWSNKQGITRVFARLDRVLSMEKVSNFWLTCSMKSSLKVYQIISLWWFILKRMMCKGSRHLSFFNMWTFHPNFVNIVQDNWLHKIVGTPMFKLLNNLKNLKKPLQTSNMKHFNKVQMRTTYWGNAEIVADSWRYTCWPFE